ncbi:hypothetical protein B484DRAFT_447031 [Ochromonadaceae sp. CCMP2298]|nr:hypothetical protein B484DRAFT_447031 [Ochromonadaceae sp. CCMP2298]|mmetsp:Transcript_22100/g.47890  ORF Transcript_22100/g.47890 Transcript_22100/m.47890 type:complete len:214 (+) Transcript_22100:114-755(+)
MQLPVFSAVLVLLIAALSTAQEVLQVTSDRRSSRACSGPTAKKGDTLLVHYEGYIADTSEAGVKGKMFDSSVKRNKPFEFKLGAGQVIQGWEEGIAGLCLGEKSTLTIPSHLGYGEKGNGNIPPHATLRFTIDVLGINENRLPVEEEPNVFSEMDANRDMAITYEEMQAWFNTMHPDKLTAIPAGLFEREDKNQDGVISFREFDGPKGLHDEL